MANVQDSANNQGPLPLDPPLRARFVAYRDGRCGEGEEKRGYRSITPPGFSEERGLPARNVFIEPLSCFLTQLHRELWLSYL